MKMVEGKIESNYTFQSNQLHTKVIPQTGKTFSGMIYWLLGNTGWTQTITIKLTFLKKELVDINKYAGYKTVEVNLQLWSVQERSGCPTVSSLSYTISRNTNTAWGQKSALDI